MEWWHYFLGCLGGVALVFIIVKLYFASRPYSRDLVEVAGRAQQEEATHFDVIGINFVFYRTHDGQVECCHVEGPGELGWSSGAPDWKPCSVIPHRARPISEILRFHRLYTDETKAGTTVPCLRCGSTKTYQSLGGTVICPQCGHGSSSSIKPDLILDKDIWTLQIFLSDKGTNSECQHGILLRDGIPVLPQDVGDMINTSLGSLRYYHPEEMWFPFNATGWNFSDASLIRPYRSR